MKKEKDGKSNAAETTHTGNKSGLNDLLYCDYCIWLRPKEHEQTNKKQPHFCHNGFGRIFHGDKHPHLPRPAKCENYEAV